MALVYDEGLIAAVHRDETRPRRDSTHGIDARVGCSVDLLYRSATQLCRDETRECRLARA